MIQSTPENENEMTPFENGEPNAFISQEWFEEDNTGDEPIIQDEVEVISPQE